MVSIGCCRDCDVTSNVAMSARNQFAYIGRSITMVCADLLLQQRRNGVGTTKGFETTQAKPRIFVFVTQRRYFKFPGQIT